MRFGVLLILMGCCLYLTTARPSDGDDESEENSQPIVPENSEGEEFDDEDFQSGSDFELDNESDEDDWFGDLEDEIKENEIENEGLNTEQVSTLKKLRQDRIQDHVKGKVHGSVQATNRLMKELSDTYKSNKSGEYSIELVDDSIYEWNVYLHYIDPDSDLYKDLQKFQETNDQNGIILNFRFKETYPFEPPFVRVVSPVIRGGFVMQGGAICMELLTSDGWSSVYTVEAIIMEISTNLVNGKGRIPPQKKSRAQNEYNIEYAKQNFERIEKLHKEQGWYEPHKTDG